MAPVASETIDVQALREVYSAAWAARDPDSIARLHTEDTHFQTHIGTPPVIGRESLRAACAEIFHLYPNFLNEARRVLYGDRHWVLEWTMHATIKRELDGKPTDKDISVDCVDVVVLSEDGLVARKDAYMDAAQLQSALGVSPPWKKDSST